MSLSHQTKLEIIQSSLPQKDCCKFAFLCGLFCAAAPQKTNMTKESKIILYSENEYLYSAVNEITLALYNINSDYKSSKIIIKGLASQNILNAIKVLNYQKDYILKTDCCKKAFIIAAFLICGHLSVESGYHLEFAVSFSKMRDILKNLLLDFNIKSLSVNRNDKFLLYLKDKDMISDTLALMGAVKAVLNLNSLMAERSFKQQISRAANCDMANLNRLVSASVLQQQAIKKLKNIDNPILRETAQARLENPDLSYEQLASLLGISKGALKYRLNKLVALASKEDNDT